MSHTIKRQAMLIEIDGQVLVVKLSAEGWKQALAIAASEGGGALNVAPAPNQAVLDLLSISATKLDNMSRSAWTPGEAI